MGPSERVWARWARYFAFVELLVGLAGAVVVLLLAGAAKAPALEPGPRVKILDTADLPDGPHYVNDHTLLRLPDGRWILTGIFHPEPYAPYDERAFLLAAAAPSEPSQWYDNPALPAFSLSPGREGLRAGPDEPWIWAPHLARDDDGSVVMIYHAGGLDPDRASFHLARSRDGLPFAREGGTLFEDICAARDPMLLRLGPSWVVYYTRCASKGSRASGVGYRVSPDLVHWSPPAMALVLPSRHDDSGHTESPFVFHRKGWFYLTVTSYPTAWDATFVYRSRSPFSFPPEPIAELAAHAAEWVAEGDGFESGRLFFTGAGPGQGGVWMRELIGL
jgi:hypothetical protein